ncbi:MAG: ABC transporter permease [Candidatus Eisenbacteria bacterium]|uniref:ABC transporter permease n=1 Tax=Eiseniibacteriota bacterium TaxID=2212470 RepID=A0A538TMX2_UNCEI|nr:MAG: ABC transporter permease [Candidatus Eisenbacteria bacterium]
MPIPISYNVRNVIQRPWSTLATTIGIALVVAILIGAFALASGFQAALVETGSDSNAMVLRTGADSEISSGISLDAAHILKALPDVAPGPDGRPLVSADMVVLMNQPRLGQEGSSNVTVRGIDPPSLALRPRVKLVAGRMFAPGSDEVIVAQRIARRFAHCGIGDRLRFGQRDFTVVGQFTAGGSGFDSEVWGDNAVLMPALNREGAYQSVTFRMRDPSRFAELKRRLESDRRLGVEVRTERAWYAGQSRLMSTVLRAGGILITLIMAVGAIFGAMNTMYAAVGQRTREIAVLLTLGFTPGAVMRAFLFESVFPALIGGALGCLIALPINGVTTSTTNWSSFSEIAFAFRVTPAGMIAGLIFAAIMGAFGGFLPARQAARQSLAMTLRAG